MEKGKGQRATLGEGFPRQHQCHQTLFPRHSTHLACGRQLQHSRQLHLKLIKRQRSCMAFYLQIRRQTLLPEAGLLRWMSES